MRRRARKHLISTSSSCVSSSGEGVRTCGIRLEVPRTNRQPTLYTTRRGWLPTRGSASVRTQMNSEPGGTFDPFLSAISGGTAPSRARARSGAAADPRTPRIGSPTARIVVSRFGWPRCGGVRLHPCPTRAAARRSPHTRSRWRRCIARALRLRSVLITAASIAEVSTLYDNPHPAARDFGSSRARRAAAVRAHPNPHPKLIRRCRPSCQWRPDTELVLTEIVAASARRITRRARAVGVAGYIDGTVCTCLRPIGGAVTPPRKRHRRISASPAGDRRRTSQVRYGSSRADLRPATASPITS